MQRYLYLLSGAREDCYRQVDDWLNTRSPHQSILYLSDSGQPLAIPLTQAKRALGSSHDVLVYDAFSGLDVNAFALVLGALKGGGVCLLLHPEPTDWLGAADQFISRFLPFPHDIEQHQSRFIAYFIQALDKIGKVSLPPDINSLQIQTAEGTEDQRKALNLLIEHGGNVVVVGQRGRGKSALLGQYLRQLSAGVKVIVTAPHKRAVAEVFRWSEGTLADCQFVPPDQLLAEEVQADIVLIDEAAALPLSVSKALLWRYQRVVFATTTNGYEGSGRGFSLRFIKWLQSVDTSARLIKLAMPIRWSVNDQLETWLNNNLLFLPPGDTFENKIEPQNIEVPRHEVLDQQKLVDSPALLRHTMRLLVEAHYQTRPSDLLQLLDSPDIHIHGLWLGESLLGLLVWMVEGGFDDALSKDIEAGVRRPQGHLLAQSLAFHAGIAGAAQKRYARIWRIVIDESYRRQGFGRFLMSRCEESARVLGIDCIGVSYAYDKAIQAFWEAEGFQALRLSHKRDRSSGTYSLMQVKGLDEANRAWVMQANRQFWVNAKAHPMFDQIALNRPKSEE